MGIPASLIGMLRDRWEGTRDTVEEMSCRLSDEARHAFDEWVGEGEKLVNELGAQIREGREKLERSIEDKTETATDRGTIRGRLREIETERKQVSDDDLEAKTDLHDEEIELPARLAGLQEMATGKPDLSKEVADQQKGKSKPEDYVTPV